VPGNAAYFSVYEGTRRELLRCFASGSTDPTLPHQMLPGENDGDGTLPRGRRLGPHLAATVLAGGLAGVANWCLCLPVDSVKTRWQTADPRLPQHLQQQRHLHHRTPWELARHMVRNEGGYASLYRGLGPALLRAFPANAAALCGVEATRHVLGLS
jgi:solute carrier family 25 carnitine/acylcarnitine transporter 20/29